jgi:hypothetical protein
MEILMTIQPKDIAAIIPESFTAKVHGMDFQVADIHNLPTQSLRKIVEYGLQRIFNDSTASGKDDAERMSLAAKRLDNLKLGVIRASGVRTGDPVKRRALELAEVAVKASPKFQAWLAENKLKAGDKAAVAQIRKNAEKAVTTEGNRFTAQAKIDVESAKGLTIDDLEFEV